MRKDIFDEVEMEMSIGQTNRLVMGVAWRKEPTTADLSERIRCAAVKVGVIYGGF